MPEQEPLSLVELSRQTDPDPDLVLASFKLSAERGVIHPGIIKDVVKYLNSGELKQAEEYMLQGEQIQRRRNNRTEANDFRDSADYIREKRLEIN